MPEDREAKRHQMGEAKQKQKIFPFHNKLGVQKNPPLDLLPLSEKVLPTQMAQSVYHSWE